MVQSFRGLLENTGEESVARHSHSHYGYQHSVMSDAVVTPQKDSDADGASSSIKRDIQRHASAADEMIQSIRNELFTPPGSSADLNTFYDDDLGDEIQRLASVEQDIRKEVNAQSVDSIGVGNRKVTRTNAETLENTLDLNKEERSGLILFVMIAFWVVVYIKQWVEYNTPVRIQN